MPASIFEIVFNIKSVILSFILLILIIMPTYASESNEVLLSSSGFSETYNFLQDPQTNNSTEIDKPVSFDSLVMLGAIKIYQVLISPSRGTNCPMTPSCSNFALQSFQQYNPFEAFIMTADRLHRCGHDLSNYNVVEINGNIRFDDPVQIPNIISVLNIDRSRDNFTTTDWVVSNLQMNTSDKLTVDKSNDEEERLFSFAEKLQAEGDYNRAITEFQRLLFYYPETKYRIQALTAIFYCYYNLKQYITTIALGEKLLSEINKFPGRDKIFYHIALAYYRLNNFNAARRCFNEVIVLNDDELREKSILLKALSFAQEYNWRDSKSGFRQISITSKYSSNARTCELLCDQALKLKPKNRTLAGVLSIIPGLGYLYDGYPQTALSAFIVNGLFFQATRSAYNNDNQSLGTGLGVISIGWYVGNIYGSVKSADRKNIQQNNDILAKFDIGFAF